MVLLPITATVASLVFKPNLFIVIGLYFGLPSFYLTVRAPQLAKKTFLYLFIPWIVLTITWEYLAYVDQAWYVNSVFRFFHNSIPLEDVPFGFFWLYLPITFWRYFLGRSQLKDRFPKSLKLLLLLLVIYFSIFLFFYFFYPAKLYLPYFYLIMGIVFCIIPLVLFLLLYPQFLQRLAIVCAYFSFLTIQFEYISLSQNLWSFPGSHFLAVLNFFGQRLPLEELLFWITLSAPAMICWYEYFADDRR